MPPKRKSRIVEEVTLQTSAPAKRTKKARKEREEMPFQDMGRDPRDNRPRYEDVDFEERAKQEHLDSLYDDDYDDDDFGGGRKLPIILGIVALILIIFLIFRTVSLGSKLEETQNQLTQSQDYKEKYEEIQLEKMQLEEQLDALQNPDANADNADENADDNEDADDNSTSSNTSTSTGAGKEYTIKEGDTMWTIAQSQMGNGADYQKILDANGMKESDPLKPGNKIKIPTAN
jgi:LysM repeat protein